jgi:hypothetical protein
MNLQQRHSSPSEEADDLEVTAELPVLDVASYEANVASATAGADVAANTTHPAQEGEHGNANDTWNIPAPALRKTAKSEAANTVLDENRARLEVNLQALSATLRDVEERLTRKGERLLEIEKALELAVAERNTTEQRARALTDEVTRTEAAAKAAETRIASLQKTLEEHQAEERARQAHDTEAQAQLVERNKQLQAQLANTTRDLEAKLATTQRDLESRLATTQRELESKLTAAQHEHATQLTAAHREHEARFTGAQREHETKFNAAQRDYETRYTAAQRDQEARYAVAQREHEARFANHAQEAARLERDLREARERNAEHLEALQSVEGRRSIFEELIGSLETDVGQRDQRITLLESSLTKHSGHESELQSELRERVTRIAALDKQVTALTAAFTQRTEQQTEGERARAGLQQTINALNGTLAERNDRIRVLEETVSRQTVAAAQGSAELERAVAERVQLLSGTASLEAALKTATARGDQQEAVARAAQARVDALESSAAAQRRRVEQLESEVAAVRAELQSSASSLQTAAVERNEHLARIAAGDTRFAELEARVSEQQASIRRLETESGSAVARVKEIEGDLRAAEESALRLEAELRNRGSRVDELEKINNEWRATVEEARHAIQDRDGLIERLEQETAASAVLVGHIQKSITRLDNDGPPQGHEPAADGATRLLIRTDGETEVVHVLGRKTTVGRTPDNDLQIDAKFISRHHAVILAGPAHAIIEDLNSTNGVMVNSRRITRQPLKDGDNVIIGKTQFRFVVRPPKAAASA